MNYDIFISYKRKSINLANNLYYRLTKRGYRTFFDLDEMRGDRFDEQIYSCIRSAKDIIVILEEGSLKSVDDNTYESDWFCKELMFSIKEKKNIIPLLLDGFKMPPESYFPEELKELSYKNALPFGGLNYFDEYINKLEIQGYLTAKPIDSCEKHSIFKFFSTEDAKVYVDGKLVGSIVGQSDEPFYFFVQRKGDYRIKAINDFTGSTNIQTVHIDSYAEEVVDLTWPNREPDAPRLQQETVPIPMDDNIIIRVGDISFKMIKVEGGELNIGATIELKDFAESNEYPAHRVSLKTFYIAEFPVTQDLYGLVMGYNKSHFEDEYDKVSGSNVKGTTAGIIGSVLVGGLIGGVVGTMIGSTLANHNKSKDLLSYKKHNPVEMVSLLEAKEFCRRLSKMTHRNFSLPTEEEWEYAARGGQKSKGYIYAGSDNIDEVAWYKHNSDQRTHPVGLKKPNELGIYDMSGNIWEWTETRDYSYYDSTTDKQGDIYVRRGGSWWHEASNCRVSKRYMSDINKRTRGLGFRIVIRTKQQML